MSSIYRNLAEEDLKIEKESLKSLEKKMAPFAASLGIRLAIVGALILSIASLAGSVYLYQSFNKEKRQRLALEAAQVQIRGKASAFEKDSAKNKAELTKVTEQYNNLQKDISKQLESSRKEVADLRIKLKDVEQKTLQMQKAAEKVQTDFDSQPVGPAIPGPAGSASAKNAASTISSSPSIIQEPQVLTVNRKFNFVVVNMGLKDGVKMGDSVKIQRDGKIIGSAAVEKIYDNFAAATIVKEPKDSPIKEGDRVSKD